MSITITELIENAHENLLKQNPSGEYIRRHKRAWKLFSNYARKHRITCFSTELAACFLKEEFGIEFTEDKLNGNISCHDFEAFVRPLLMLSIVQTGGTILRISKFDRTAGALCFEGITKHYEELCQKRNNSKSTIDARFWTIRPFLLHLTQSGITDISQMEATHIHQFTVFNAARALKSINQKMNNLRAFIEFLYEENYIPKDLSKCVLKAPKPRPRLAKTWTKEEVERILGVIERGTSVGKRDFAVFMLVTQLGLRTGDVVNMTFDNLLWSECKIRLIQDKTGKPLELPLSAAVGDAIIDYLKYGRPKEENSQYVFVRHTFPFGKVKNFWHPMQKYLRAAHVPVCVEKPHGFHTFRFTLATRLLDEEVPIETISAILGHSNSDSTRIYIRADINKLRQCALNPEAVYG
ncbi:MAG: site-specific integrase [Anaerotignum sp.]|nr:site-specific integrase [Anaerotignum sp.]